MTNDDKIEQKIQSKGLTAPRLTPELIDKCIASENYYTFPATTFTICLLTLKNGYNVFGESACVSAENFDAEIGREIAKEQAKQKVWALEGYLLRQGLHDAS
jgi:hypothetical protein